MPLITQLSRRFFPAHQGLSKILRNIGWLFLDRALRMTIGFFVGVWLARYLGPSNYGTLSLAIAFITLFEPTSTLGLQSIVVKNIVTSTSKTTAILGSTFALRVFGGAASLIIAIATAQVFFPNNTSTALLVSILSPSLLLKSTETVKYWFEAQVESKYIVWIGNIVFLLFSALRIYLIIIQAPLVAFAWTITAETATLSFALLAIYSWRTHKLFHWHPQLICALALLRQGWPLLLSGIAVILYMRIDQIMLGYLADSHAIGIYSAAVKISEALYFIPTAIVSSVFPSILKTKQKSRSLYYHRLQQLYDALTNLFLALAAILSLSSTWIVHFLFGPVYNQTATVLSIHIWTGVFISLGIASSSWLLAENLQRQALFRTICGLIVNIIGNAILIPYYGPVGAAVSTLASQVIAAYLYDATQPALRYAFSQKTASFFYFLPPIREALKVSP